MVYKRFYIQVIIRTVFVFLNMLWLAWIVIQPLMLYTFITASLLLIIQFFLFIHYINKTNRELNRFFISLKDEYSSVQLSSDRRGSFQLLSEILNETQEIIRNAKLEKEKQFHFLEFIIQNLKTGIIAFDENKRSIQYNSAVLGLLAKNSFRHFDEFNSLDNSLAGKIEKLPVGQSEIIRIRINGKPKVLLFHKYLMKFEGKVITLVSVQDFRNELEANELESWKKLIRVLNHEIMNSMTPISTLIHASEKSLENIVRVWELIAENEDYQDVKSNLRSIEKRSHGLVEFIKKYRSLTKNPDLNTSDISLSELLKHINTLFQENCKEKGINMQMNVEPSNLMIHADPNLLEQVLINILKNAVDALKDTEAKQIDIKATREESGQVRIGISDNGEGIPDEIFDEIFTPFFTTRKQGVGVGLSLSRQIMKLHGGSIEITSIPGKGTEVELKLGNSD